jgi:hypothetical protein
MSFREYLHEKAAESRHNETIAYIMFLTGALFYVGGTLVTLNITDQPNWLLIFPYSAAQYSGSILGLTLSICGFSLLILGIIAGLYFSHDRGWYMQELHKANSTEDAQLRNKSKNTNKKQKAKT